MNRTVRRVAGIALSVAACVTSVSVVRADEIQETKEQRDGRMAWWRDARFGMFIHWGVYSVPAGVYKGEQVKHIGEWIMRDKNIPVAEYAEYAKQFNPVKFDADTWVKLAKDAGMKYIVITSKHHDGFAMFHSKATPYNIYDATPFKRDPLAELAAACKKYDMRLGFYYSQAQDWHHPGGAAAKGGHWDPAQDGSMDDYVDKVAVPQVKEILSNYGPVAVLWWDTPVSMNKERADKLYAAAKELQPNLITNNRLGGGYQGDTETPEQYIPATGFPGRDFEVCMTMNDTWGYKSWDHNWKSTETLLRNLIDIASKGGNYLLNVGPSNEGLIPDASVERLQQIGQWMKANGDAIYGTTASPFRKYAFDGRVTVKGDRLFVHVFNWDKPVTLAGLMTKVESAAVLATGEPAQFTTATTPDGLPAVTIAKPTSTDPIATVVALKLAGPAEVDNSAIAVKPATDGSITLAVADASLSGKLKLQGQGAGENIGYWTGKRDTVTWDALVPAAGEYAVELTYSCEDKSAGASYTLSSAGASLKGKVDATGSWNDFKAISLGTLHLDKGVQTLMIHPTDVPNSAVMNLKSVKLTPAK